MHRVLLWSGSVHVQSVASRHRQMYRNIELGVKFNETVIKSVKLSVYLHALCVFPLYGLTHERSRPKCKLHCLTSIPASPMWTMFGVLSRKIQTTHFQNNHNLKLLYSQRIQYVVLARIVQGSSTSWFVGSGMSVPFVWHLATWCFRHSAIGSGQAIRRSDASLYPTLYSKCILYML